jgi:endoglucanase
MKKQTLAIEMKSKFFIVALLGLMISMGLKAQLPPAQQIASKMSVGWNLGNTLEVTWGPTGTATQRLIDSVRATGFNSVRLPCAWYHNSNKTTNIIDTNYLALVKKNIDYCIKDSMYVMINIHWDEGWLENHVTVADSASVNVRQKAFWTQIANYFKDYDEHLLFACANEPNSQEDAIGRAVLESYTQTFIKAVRGTGGNNSSRTLIFQGHPEYSTIPTDEITDRLMFEAHSYGYQFALLENDMLNPWCGGCGDTLYCIYYWGKGNHSAIDTKHNPTYDEEAEIDNFFSNTLKTRFVDKGIPVILGEYGAWKRGTLAAGADRELHNKSIEYYYFYMVKSAISNGAIPFVWDTGSLFDRSTGKVNDTAIVNAMMQASTDTIPVTDISINYVIDSIAIGATTALTATISPLDATYKTVTWTSNNPRVATVNSSGLVTGHKGGRTIISAVSGVKLATLQITVGIPVTGVSIEPKRDTIKIGETKQLVTNILPSNASDKSVSWSSSQTKVATISASGLVTAVSKGTTTITAKTIDGNFKSSCVIKVTDTLTSATQAVQFGNISIFPNPLDGKQLTVDFGGLRGKTTIQFIKMNGQTVLEQTVFDKQCAQLDINLKPGIYIVRFSNNQNTLLKKLVVK